MDSGKYLAEVVGELGSSDSLRKRPRHILATVFSVEYGRPERLFTIRLDLTMCSV